MVALYLADGFEEIEAVTVFDILKRAEADVVLVGIGSNEITGAHGLVVKVDTTISNHDEDKIDMAVLPGGMPGTKNLKESPELAKTLVKLHSKGKRIAAICAAPSILGTLGLLKGKEAICYPGYEKYLDGAVISNKSTVTDGCITTSKGAGTAMDFALELVRLLKGEDIWTETAKKLQYDTEGVK